MEKGDNCFDNPKRSKVNNNFLVSRKITRLDFNSTQIQLLNFSHNSLLDNENASLTFDLLESSKTVIAYSYVQSFFSGYTLSSVAEIDIDIIMCD